MVANRVLKTKVSFVGSRNSGPVVRPCRGRTVVLCGSMRAMLRAVAKGAPIRVLRGAAPRAPLVAARRSLSCLPRPQIVPRLDFLFVFIFTKVLRLFRRPPYYLGCRLV